jgi:uncharacterized protein
MIREFLRGAEIGSHAMFHRILAAMCLCLSLSVETQTQTPKSLTDASPAPVAIVEKVAFKLEPHSLAIEIVLSTASSPETARLTDPDRLVFDFHGFRLQAANRQVPVNHGPVRQLRVGLFQSEPPVTRIVVDLNAPVNFDVKSEGNRVLIEIPFSPVESVSAASPPRSVAVEEKVKQKPPGDAPATPLEAPFDAPITGSRTTAYSLQAKAKALRLEDLQGLEDRAAARDPEAETTLALAYHAATLLRRDDTEALRLLHQAADRGFMPAEESLGIFSETGIGMKQPAPAEALDWYKKATQQGSLDAATNMALMYADGIGIPKDQTQAVIWFRRAAEGGDATAQYNLALKYRRGEGVSQDDKQSLRWLTAAADQEVLPAMLDLASLCLHPPNGTAADIGQAIHYYEKAAEQGSTAAEAMLGNIFATGAGGKTDYEQALKWYRKAAEQGQPDAQFGLAVQYSLGQGVPADPGEALRLYTAAADQGHAGAQYNLALMYEEAKVTPRDRSLAMHYYKLAADQGVPQAQFRLGRLLTNNTDSRSDLISAYKWLMLAQDLVRESSPVLSDLRRSMSQQEINEAERQVDNWRIAHPQNHRR